MIKIEKVGDGLIIPLSQPTWCLRPVGEEFASFTTFIEWLNPGIVYEQVVGAWLGLDWAASADESRITWARQQVCSARIYSCCISTNNLQTTDVFAERHWGHVLVEAEKEKGHHEKELKRKMTELSKVTGPTLLRASELSPLPLERAKTRRGPQVCA